MVEHIPVVPKKGALINVFIKGTLKWNSKSVHTNILFSKNSNVTNFAVICPLAEDEAKVKIWLFNFAYRNFTTSMSTWRLRFQVFFFCNLSTLAIYDFLKLATLSHWLPRNKMTFIITNTEICKPWQMPSQWVCCKQLKNIVAIIAIFINILRLARCLLVLGAVVLVLRQRNFLMHQIILLFRVPLI